MAWGWLYYMCIYALFNVNLLVVCKAETYLHSNSIGVIVQFSSINIEILLYTTQVLWHKMLMRRFNILSQTSAVALSIVLQVKSHHLAVGVASAHFLAF